MVQYYDAYFLRQITIATNKTIKKKAKTSKQTMVRENGTNLHPFSLYF